MLAFLQHRAGAHRRRHAAGEEGLKRRPSLDRRLADGGEPLLHDAVIGAACAKPIAGGGRIRLERGGQGSELVEQAVILTGGIRPRRRRGDPGQGLLDGADARTHPLCLRQSEEGQQPVGLDFEKALGQRARPCGPQSLVDDQNPDEAVGIGAEIRGSQCPVAIDMRDCQAGMVEQRRNIGDTALRHDVKVGGGEQRSGRLQPRHNRTGTTRARAERFAGAGPLDRIGGEFRVMLPPQRPARQDDAVVAGALGGRRDTPRLAPGRQGLPVRTRHLAGRHEGQVEQPPRRFERMERPGMDLGQNRAAQRVGNDDGGFRGHDGDQNRIGNMGRPVAGGNGLGGETRRSAMAGRAGPWQSRNRPGPSPFGSGARNVPASAI